MSNWIATVEVYKVATARRSQINLRDVTITDLQDARKEIDKKLAEEGFEYTQEELDSYYITFLVRVDDTAPTYKEKI